MSPSPSQPVQAALNWDFVIRAAQRLTNPATGDEQRAERGGIEIGFFLWLSPSSIGLIPRWTRVDWSLSSRRGLPQRCHHSKLQAKLISVEAV